MAILYKTKGFLSSVSSEKPLIYIYAFIIYVSTPAVPSSQIAARAAACKDHRRDHDKQLCARVKDKSAVCGIRRKQSGYFTVSKRQLPGGSRQSCGRCRSPA